jgi:small subunit ribosomal protein S8
MTLNDTLATVLSQIDNANRVGKATVTTMYSSSLIKKVLEMMQSAGYIDAVEEVEDSKGNYLIISLSGKLNKCGVIKPRFAVQADNYEKFEKRFLPARGFGMLLVSTNLGLLSHEEAKEKNVGGKLISFVY